MENTIMNTLTKRQKEVVALVAQGLSNKETARRLKVREGTITQHLYAIYQKLGVRNRTELSVKHARTPSVGPGSAPELRPLGLGSDMGVLCDLARFSNAC